MRVKNLFITFLLLCTGIGMLSLSAQEYTLQASISKIESKVFIFNGISSEELGWGMNYVYELNDQTIDESERTMGPLSGLPLVDLYNQNGGVAVFNTTTHFEPFAVKIVELDDRFEIYAKGGTNIEVIEHTGDYYDAIREFALLMQSKGLCVQTAPKWGFDAIWETYGFEEDWDKQTVINLLPVLKKLNITTITLDSGWFGEGRKDWDSQTGDFPINPDVIGSEQDFKDFVALLHSEGFKVRVWSVPGVAEKGTELYKNHPDWFYKKVISSTGDTGDWYLYPDNEAVQKWHTSVIERFMAYGLDGIKQDDVFQIISDDPQYHIAFQKLYEDAYSTAKAINPEVVINTCNCGVVQNFFHIGGENQLITSDPLGAGQARHRAKYLHALNVNNAAILGDHIELTRGDAGPEDIDEVGFYNSVNFESVVALGMVLETKFKEDPGEKYKKWFNIYNEYQFYNMEWVNIPLLSGELESYMLANADTLYPSFFTTEVYDDGQDWLFLGKNYTGQVTLSNLTPGLNYEVYDISNDKELGVFKADSSSYTLDASFYWSVLLEVKPTTRELTDSLVIEGELGVINAVNNFSFESINFQTYPNPFKTTINIQFNLPDIRHVKLSIFNINGKQVQILLNKTLLQGINEIEWSGKDISGNSLPNGYYFVRLEAEDIQIASKILFQK